MGRWWERIEVVNLAETQISVRAQDLRHGASGCVSARPWQLRTLAAYLFDGRECREVRQLLAIGSGIAHGTRLSWEAVELSEEELSAIEATFPLPMPSRTLAWSEVRCVVMIEQNGELKTASVENAVVVEAAARAGYMYFDYGPWADLFESTLPDGVVLRYEVPRPGVEPPWVSM